MVYIIYHIVILDVEIGPSFNFQLENSFFFDIGVEFVVV